MWTVMFFLMFLRDPRRQTRKAALMNNSLFPKYLQQGRNVLVLLVNMMVNKVVTQDKTGKHS